MGSNLRLNFAQKFERDLSFCPENYSDALMFKAFFPIACRKRIGQKFTDSKFYSINTSVIFSNLRGAYSAVRYIAVDLINPQTAITGPSAGSWQNGNFIVSISDVDDGSGIDGADEAAAAPTIVCAGICLVCRRIG